MYVFVGVIALTVIIYGLINIRLFNNTLTEMTLEEAAAELSGTMRGLQLAASDLSHSLQQAENQPEKTAGLLQGSGQATGATATAVLHRNGDATILFASQGIIMRRTATGTTLRHLQSTVVDLSEAGRSSFSATGEALLQALSRQSVAPLKLIPTPRGPMLALSLPGGDGPELYLLYSPRTLLGQLAASVALDRFGISLVSEGTLYAVWTDNSLRQHYMTGSATDKAQLLGDGNEKTTLFSSPVEGFGSGSLALAAHSERRALLNNLSGDSRFIYAGAGFLAVVVGVTLFFIINTINRRRPYKPNILVDENYVRNTARQGESGQTEFKSTLRKNLKSGKNDKNIELASLKAVASFLNSEGGTLLVGVGDDGEILGLEPDGFDNEDHAMRHFSNLVTQHLGIRHFNEIAFHVVHVDGKMVLAVICRKSTEPVFLSHRNEEWFLVRQGPSNKSLCLSEFYAVSRRFRH